MSFDNLTNAEKCNGSAWIFGIFDQCISGDITKDSKTWSFIFGLISMLIWLIPTLPQIYDNFKRKNCESLSMYFVFLLFIGDLLNLTGSIMSNQLMIQIYVACYFVTQSSIMTGQYLYYNVFKSNNDYAAVSSNGIQMNPKISVLFIAYIFAFIIPCASATSSSLSKKNIW